MLRRAGSALLFGHAEPQCHDAEAVGSELQWALRLGQGLPPAKQAMPAAEKHEASRSEVFLFHKYRDVHWASDPFTLCRTPACDSRWL